MGNLTIDELESQLKEVNEDWAARESVNWEEAELIAQACTRPPLASLPAAKKIREHAEEYEDWDSGVVGEWPQQLLEDIARLRERTSDNDAPSP